MVPPQLSSRRNSIRRQRCSFSVSMDSYPGNSFAFDSRSDWVSLCLISGSGFFPWLFSDLRKVLSDEDVYNEAASEAFPLYNKSHMICLDMPGTSGDVSLAICLISLMTC